VSIDKAFVYDGHIALELYRNYLDDIASDELTMRYLKRLVIWRIRKKYKAQVPDAVIEDLIQQILMEIWVKVKKRALPTRTVEIFHQYLYTLIRRQTGRGFKAVYDDAPKELDPDRWENFCFARLPTVYDIEDSMFAKEVPRYICQRIMANLRLEGGNYTDAVLYVMDRLFTNKRIVRNKLKIHFRVKNPTFLVQHVKIRMRHVLYEVRKNFTKRSKVYSLSALDVVLEDQYDD
jgi:hypothetical protein